MRSLRLLGRVLVTVALCLVCLVHADAASWADDEPSAGPTTSVEPSVSPSVSPPEASPESSDPEPSSSAQVVIVEGFSDFSDRAQVALALLVFLAAAGFVLSWKR